MDPLSIVTTVGGLIGTCAQVAKRANDLIGAYNDAPLAVSSIASETAVLSAALSQIENIAIHSPNSLVSKLSGQVGFRTAFDTGLSSCNLVLSVLEKELLSITGGKQASNIGKLGRVKAIWSQDQLQGLLQQIRGQQIGLNLLISALQTESLAEIKDILHRNSSVLNKIVRQTGTLHLFAPNPSVGNAASSQSSGITNGIGQLALGTVGSSSVQSSTIPILDGTGPIRETTAFLADRMINAIEQNDSDLIDRLLLRGYDVNFLAAGNRTPLIAAVKKGNVGLVEKLLDCRADTEARDNDSKTALIWSAEKGLTAITKSLVERGAKINAGGHQGMDALNQAAYSGQFAVVEALLGFGADIETLDDDRMNPLHNASQFGHYKAMDILLRMGAKVNVFDKRHRTALLWAVVSENAAAVELLTRWGADTDVQDDEGYLPIHWASTRNSVDVLSVFLRTDKYVRAMSRNDLKVQPLHHAAADGKVDNINLLLDKNADIEALDAKNQTALFQAVDQGHVNAVKALLRKNAKVTGKTTGGYSALTIAVISGSVPIAKELLDASADIGETYEQRSLLALAVQSGKVEMVAFLLDRNVDINQKSGPEYSTALQDAVFFRNVDMIRFLIRKGASVNVKDINLATPIHRTAFTGNCEILEVLLGQADKSLINAAMETGLTALHFATKEKRIAAAKLLIRYKAKITVTDNEGNQPIHTAAEANCSELIRLFIKEGASVKAKTNFDNTPLHCATGAEAVDALLQHKASMEQWNKWSQTPLDRMAYLGHEEAAVVMLRRGAKVDCLTRDKETPLHRAIVENHPKLVKLLIDYNASITYTIGRRKLNSLHIAVETKDIDIQIVKYLLDKEPQLLNTPDKEGKTPLYMAIDMGAVAVAILFLDRGAATECPDKDGWTPLILASRKEQWDVVTHLLKKGCNVFARNKDENRTALHYTAITARVDMAKLLLDRGLNPQDKDAWGTTALDCAIVRSPNPKMAELLSKGG